MKKQAEVIELAHSKHEKCAPTSRIRFGSGHQVLVHAEEEGEWIEVTQPEGEVVLTIRLTDAGPVISARGAQLELKSTGRIALDARQVAIHAQEKTTVESDGGLAIESADRMDIQSRDDIRVNGKMIHLN